MIELSSAGKAAQAQIGQPYYGLVYLALATLCYRAQGGATSAVIQEEIQSYVEGQFLPALPAASGGGNVAGRWQMEWGPAITGKNANLMFVLSYRDTSSDAVGDPPIFAAACIRGTDIASTYRGDMTQFIEDLDAGVKVKWDSAVKGDCAADIAFDPKIPRIAQGTCRGLQDLIGATAGTPAQSVEDCLAGFLNAYPGTPVVVTGHSLGGCQTTVMAMYLKQKLGGARFCPNPFAPPTAGNTAFAAMFNDAFAGSGGITGNLWWNDMDLVPQAFHAGRDRNDIPSLHHIPDLWERYGGPLCPIELQTLVAGLADLYHHYEHPIMNASGDGAKRNFRLRGSAGGTAQVKAFLDNMSSGLDPASWVAQVLYQHFPPVYYQLMTSQVAGLAPYPFLPVAPPLAA